MKTDSTKSRTTLRKPFEIQHRPARTRSLAGRSPCFFTLSNFPGDDAAGNLASHAGVAASSSESHASLKPHASGSASDPVRSEAGLYRNGMAFGLSRGRCHELIDCHEESTTLLWSFGRALSRARRPKASPDRGPGRHHRSRTAVVGIPGICHSDRGGLAQFLFRLQPETHSVTHGASRVFPKRECMSTNLVRGNGGCLRSVFWIEASPVRGVGECRSLSGVNTDRFDPRSGGTADFA